METDSFSWVAGHPAQPGVRRHAVIVGVQGGGRTDSGDGDLNEDDLAGAGVVLGQELQVGPGCLVAAAEPVSAEAVVLDLTPIAHDPVVVEGPRIARGKVQIPLFGPAVDEVEASSCL